jgi:mannosyltransferase
MLNDRPQESTTFLERFYYLLILILLGIGAFLRFHQLGAKSLWLDEASSVSFARMPWPQFLRTMWYGEANMAAYYVLLKGWLHFGDSEFWLRSSAALAGIATIAATAMFAKRFLSRSAGLLAAALLTVHGFHIQYSQELRSYSLLALLLVLSAYAFLSALEAPDEARSWIAYVIFSSLAVYAQVFAVFVLASQWLVLAPARIKRIGWARLIAVAAGLGFCVAPMVAVLVLENKGQIDWVPRPNLTGVVEVLQDIAGASANQPITASTLSLLLLYFVAWASSPVSLRKDGQNAARVQTPQPATALIAWWLFFSFAIMLLLSFKKPIFYPRYLFLCVPAAVLLAGQGLAELARRGFAARMISACLFVGMMALSCLSARDYFSSFSAYGHDWRDATNYVLAHQNAGDAAVIYTFSGHRVFDYYVRRESEEHKAESAPEVLFPLGVERREIEVRTEPYPRIWLILHQTRRSAFTDQQTETIQKALKAHFRPTQEIAFPGESGSRGEEGTIRIILYVAGPADEASELRRVPSDPR